MSIQFQGISHYSGASDTVVERVRNVKDFVNATAVRPTNAEQTQAEGVVLTGKDMVSFMKDNYQLDVPPELINCQTQDDLITLLFSTTSTSLKKAIGALMDFAMNADQDQVDQKVFDYYTAKKAGGQDLEGNPIVEIQV